jgi:hypothetical protein
LPGIVRLSKCSKVRQSVPSRLRRHPPAFHGKCYQMTNEASRSCRYCRCPLDPTLVTWNIAIEIMEQTAYIREWGGNWLLPIPEVRVIS